MSRVMRWSFGSLFALLLAGAPGVRAESPPRNWLPIPPEEGALTDSAIEPGADAEALWIKCWITDRLEADWMSMADYYFRIKIYTPAGAQRFAKIDIDYALTGESIDDVRARVVQPDGTIGALDKRLVVSDIRTRRRGTGIRRTSFALPGVRPGCIVEYRYRRLASGVHASAHMHEFQFDVPARRVEYHVDPVAMHGVRLKQLTFHAAVHPLRDGVEVTDEPAYQPEPDSPPEYQVRAWTIMYYTAEDDQPQDAFWRAYGRKNWEWADGFTRPDAHTTELARGLCAGAPDDLARVRCLSEWMRREFRLLHSADPETLRAARVHKNGNAREALAQRAGTAMDADLALVALARGAGLQARLLLVPTREWLFFDPRMMHGGFLNSYDAAIRIDGRWLAFDVAAPRLPWDMIPWSEEGQPALLCDPDSSRFIETQVAEPDRSGRSVAGTLALDDEGTLEGDLVTTCTGHENQASRALLDDVTGSAVDSAFVEALGWNRPGVEVSHVELDRGAHEWDPLVIRSHVRMKEQATVTDKRMIFEPGAMRAHEPARFTAETRRLPVCFDHPWFEHDSLRIAIPAGWKAEAVSSPPAAGSEGVAEYRCSIAVRDDNREVMCVRSFLFGFDGSTYFAPRYYPAVKRLFDDVHRSDATAITFVRESRP